MVKEKKCAAPGCNKSFKPKARTTEKVCSWKCAIDLGRHKARQKHEKELKKDTQKRKEKLKSISDYESEAQAVINQNVRLRD